MIINREFYFRGWLPAGLLINARLLTSAPEGAILPVLKPLLNPYPGRRWPVNQPAPVFPIEQATPDTAVVLADPLPEGTVVLTMTPDWNGEGTPFILAVNTWYEGRIRSISGSDVTATRIMSSTFEDYYSYYSGLQAKDVRVYNMPCRHILGRNSEQVLLGDSEGKATDAIGWPPMVTDGSPAPARVVDLLQLTSMSFAGMGSVYSELNPGSETIVVQCAIVDGRHPGDPIKKVALAIAPKVGRQKFYSIADRILLGDSIDVIRKPETFATIAKSRSIPGSDQVVHYN